MKLPGIGYKTGVASLGRRQVGGELAVATAEARAIGSLVGAANQSLQLIGRYQDRAEEESRISMEKTKREADIAVTKARNDLTRRQVAQEDVGVSEDAALWTETNADKKFYNSTEVDESIPVKRTEINIDPATGVEVETPRQIPSYEVQPYLRAKYLESSVNERAKSIEDPTVRAVWISRKMSAVNKLFASDMIKATNQREAYEKAEYQVGIDEDVQNGDFALAKEKVTSNPYTTDVEKDMSMKIVNNQEALTNLDHILFSEKRALMKVTYDALKEGEYKNVTRQQRKTYMTSLRSALKVEKQKKTELEKYTEAKILEGGRIVGDDLINGDEVDTRAVVQAQHALSFLNTAQAQLVRDRINLGLSTQGIRTEMGGMDINGINQYMDDLKTDVDSPVRQKQWDVLSQTAEKYIADIRKDTIAHGDGKLYTLIPIDLQEAAKKQDAEAIQDWILSRDRGMQISNANYNNYTGYLTQEEAPIIANDIAQMDDATRTFVYGVMVQTLGKNAVHVFEQLQSYGLKGSFAMTGEMAAKGVPSVGRLIQRGDRIRKDPKNYEFAQPFADTDFDELTMGLFKGMETYKESFRDAYHSIIATQQTSPQDYNSKYAKNAFNWMSGGSVAWQGARFVTPSYGMSQFDLDNTMESLSAEELSKMGTAANFSQEATVKYIKSGQFKLVPLQNNRFHLFDKASGLLVGDKNTGREFVFRIPIGDDIITTEDVARKSEIAEAERRIKAGEKPLLRDRYDLAQEALEFGAF